jgi:hypothetical protein
VIHRSVGLRDYRVHWDVDYMERGMQTAQITLIICYQIELDKSNINETLTCSIPKIVSLSSATLSIAREERVDEEVEVLVCRQA